jgi:hypothetical protein
MIALIIGTFALVTLAQFSLSWWRAMMAQVADHPLSARARTLTEHWAPAAGRRDFEALISLHETCPVPGSGKLGLVRQYYRVLESLKSFAARFSPSLAEWAQSEMDVCYRYAVVRVDERLTRAHAMIAEMRAF